MGEEDLKQGTTAWAEDNTRFLGSRVVIFRPSLSIELHQEKRAVPTPLYSSAISTCSNSFQSQQDKRE